jgi:hypothetical protein
MFLGWSATLWLWLSPCWYHIIGSCSRTWWRDTFEWCKWFGMITSSLIWRWWWSLLHSSECIISCLTYLRLLLFSLFRSTTMRSGCSEKLGVAIEYVLIKISIGRTSNWHMWHSLPSFISRLGQLRGGWGIAWWAQSLFLLLFLLFTFGEM